MKAIIVPNPNKDNGLSVTRNIISKLSEVGITAYLSREYASHGISGVDIYDSIPTDADFIVVIGGDGSVIDASLIALSLDLPILGVNLGKVGYLSALDPCDTDVLCGLSNGYRVVERMLLCAVLKDSEGNSLLESRFAVNDIVVSHGEYFGISDFNINNSSGESVKYRADGVIVSTPMGSTAYSLSAGGPLISHALDSITVTPVCPHSFFNRSIVYEPSEILTVRNNGEATLKVSVDGRFFADLPKDYTCEVKRAPRRLKMIYLSKCDAFSNIFTKIKLYE